MARAVGSGDADGRCSSERRLGCRSATSAVAGPASRGRGQRQAHLDRAEAQLAEYFAGTRRTFDVALDPAGTDVPAPCVGGPADHPVRQTISYGEQAAELGEPGAARAVGAANGRNPLSIVVPCHRVVAASGALTGFAGGLDTKAWLLDHERAVLAGG